MEDASEYAMKWFTNNCMIVNLGKFNGNSILKPLSVRFLCIKTDNHLNFQSHISTICKNAAWQLNALSRLKSSESRSKEYNC